MKVTVCIASVGRDSLLETLNSIANCEIPSDVFLDVVIADDSKDLIIKSMVDHHFPNWKYQISVFASASGNIAIARNVCLANASGEYLAFIDDDETADRGWIASYIQQINRSEVDAIFGPVDAIYPIGAEKWICDGQPFVKRVGDSNTKQFTGSTCNAFVKRKTLLKFNLLFNPSLGRTGGEDTDFFYRLAQLGGTLVGSDSALVYEKVALDRLSINHLSRRYIRGGQTYATLMISSGGLGFQLVNYFLAFIKVVLLIFVVPALFVFKRNICLKYAFKLWLNVGKLRRLFKMQPVVLY